MTLKIRVMPSCWFILSRFDNTLLYEYFLTSLITVPFIYNYRIFTRVDGTLVSIRDARFFHVFGTSKIYLDLTWQRQYLENDLSRVTSVTRNRGDGISFPMSHSPGMSTTATEKSVPNNLIRDSNAWSRVLPDVTNMENIHKHFELVISDDTV